MAFKLYFFILGLIVLAVSGIGIAVNLGQKISFLASMPLNPVIYLAIDALVGFIIIISSFQKRGRYVEK